MCHCHYTVPVAGEPICPDPIVNLFNEKVRNVILNGAYTASRPPIDSESRNQAVNQSELGDPSVIPNPAIGGAGDPVSAGVILNQFHQITKALTRVGTFDYINMIHVTDSRDGTNTYRETSRTSGKAVYNSGYEVSLPWFTAALNAIKEGNPISISNLNVLFNECLQLWTNSTKHHSSIINYYCHDNCHTNCHNDCHNDCNCNCDCDDCNCNCNCNWEWEQDPDCYTNQAAYEYEGGTVYCHVDVTSCYGCHWFCNCNCNCNCYNCYCDSSDCDDCDDCDNDCHMNVPQPGGMCHYNINRADPTSPGCECDCHDAEIVICNDYCNEGADTCEGQGSVGHYDNCHTNGDGYNLDVDGNPCHTNYTHSGWT